MDTTRIQEQSRRFTLNRVHENGSMEFVSDHPDFAEGWDAGTTATHAEPESAFSLYRPNGQRIARFGHHRLATNDAAALDLLALS